jgi:hypothetical protein
MMERDFKKIYKNISVSGGGKRGLSVFSLGGVVAYEDKWDKAQSPPPSASTMGLALF